MNETECWSKIYNKRYRMKYIRAEHACNPKNTQQANSEQKEETNNNRKTERERERALSEIYCFYSMNYQQC